MAKIKFGMMMTDARGKLGGQVFSKNRSGAIVRTKVTPANPQTSYQQAVRQLLGSLSQQWASLTEAQKLAWNNAVTAWSSTNVFGDVVNPSGKNLYVRLNINLVNIGESVIDEPPAVPTMPVFALAVTNTTAAAAEVTTAGTLAGFAQVIRSTPAISAGIFNASGRFRTINNDAGSAAGALDVATPFDLKYGSMTVGQKVFVEVTLISETSGANSVPLTVSFIVT